MTVELLGASVIDEELDRNDVAAYASVKVTNAAGVPFPVPDGVFGIARYVGYRAERVEHIADWFAGKPVPTGPHAPVRYLSTSQIAALLGQDYRRVNQWVHRYNPGHATPFITPAVVLLWPARAQQGGWRETQMREITAWAQPLLVSGHQPRVTDQEMTRLRDNGQKWVDISKRAGLSPDAVRQRVRRYKQEHPEHAGSGS